MWCSKKIFSLCEELKQWGVVPPCEPGQIVARGFADLGFEEFLVMPSAKILSLSAGTMKPLPDDDKHHFFWIPSCEELVSEIEKCGAENISTSRIDRRTWSCTSVSNFSTIALEGSTLQETLLLVLLEVIKRSKRGLNE